MKTHVATTDREVAEVVARLRDAPRIACDIESNGMFVYRASLCIVQLATPDETFLVDTIAASPAPLGPLLAKDGPLKIVHDVAFDARILAEVGIELGNVHDTSIGARMLGRTATGLASLLGAELGVTLDKSMQQHDWSRRPLDDRALAYLCADVVHLHALDDKLWKELSEKNIEREVAEETLYRLATAIEGAREPDRRPPYVRVKGVDRLKPPALAVLRRLCEVREQEAARVDVPPYKVVGNEVLLELSDKRPTSMADLGRVRGARSGRAGSIAGRMLDAIRQGLADGDVPDEDRPWLERPRVPSALARARRDRESRLLAWRRAEAKNRGVDEQVVLPGHCAKDLAGIDEPSIEAVAAVPGLGAFRFDRDGEAILKALVGGPK